MAKKADGEVLINTKINTDGIDKGNEEIKRKLTQNADAAADTAEKIEKSMNDIDVSKAAEGLGASFANESEKASDSLGDIGGAAQDAAKEQAKAFENSWEDVKNDSHQAALAIIEDIDGIGDEAEQASDDIEEELGNTFKNLAEEFSEGFIGGVVGGIASAVANEAIETLGEVKDAAIEFGKEAIELSSNLEEVQNVVEIAFPTMANRVNTFAEAALEAAGLSEFAAKQIAGNFGLMFTGAEIAEEEAYEMATTLTQLAADLGSLYNKDIETVFQKLQSGFTGEYEALRDLNVFMSENALLSFAVSEGMIDTSKSVEQLREETLALEEAQLNLEKTQESYNKILEEYDGSSFEAREASLDLEKAYNNLAKAQEKLNQQNKPTLDNLNDAQKKILQYKFILNSTKQAQGDFVRTQESWANQVKILNTNFQELMTTVGSGLIDALTPTLNFINDELIPVLQYFAEEFAKAMDPTPAEDLERSIREMQDTFADAQQQYRDTAIEIEANARMAEYLTERLEELEVAGVNTKEEFVEYQGIVEKLNELYPNLNLLISEETGLLEEGTGKIWERIEAEKELAKAEAMREYMKTLYENELNAMQAIAEAKYNMTELEAEERAAIEALAQSYGVSYKEMEKRIADFYEFSKEHQGDISLTLSGINNIKLDPLVEQYVNVKDQQQQLTEEIGEGERALADLQRKNDDVIKSLGEMSSEISETEDAQSDLTGAVEYGADAMAGSYEAFADRSTAAIDSVTESLRDLQKFSLGDFEIDISQGRNVYSSDYNPYAGYALDAASIPALARGAVIPPNAPFTAVLGDQKNGYNLEGPEEMFRGIVREELEANSENETANLLRQLIGVVQGISVGDDTIGQAANRYNRKMNTARGVW